jgi:hypothetical protein
MIKAVVISPEGERSILELDPNDPKPMQEAVGGWIEMIRSQVEPSLLGFVNEDGKRLGLELNVIASGMLGYPVVGNAVFATDKAPSLGDAPEAIRP